MFLKTLKICMFFSINSLLLLETFADYTEHNFNCETPINFATEKLEFNPPNNVYILKIDGKDRECEWNLNVSKPAKHESYGIYVHIVQLPSSIIHATDDYGSCKNTTNFMKIDDYYYCVPNDDTVKLEKHWKKLAIVMSNETHDATHDGTVLPIKFNFKDADTIVLNFTYFTTKNVSCSEEQKYEGECTGKCLEDDSFPCLSRCIHKSLKCDGHNNCGDPLDEMSCPSGSSAAKVILIILLVVITGALILISIRYYKRRNYSNN